MLRPGQRVEARRTNVNIGLYAYDEYVVEYVRENGDVLLRGLDFFVPGRDVGPIPDPFDALDDAKSTIQQQAEALGTANRDLAAWAERCERAENLLRGYLQNVNRGELDHKAREHFMSLGERQ